MFARLDVTSVKGKGALIERVYSESLPPNARGTNFNNLLKLLSDAKSTTSMSGTVMHWSSTNMCCDDVECGARKV